MTDDVELRLRNLSSTAVLRRSDENAITSLHIGAKRTGPDIRIPAVVAAALIAILIANVFVAYFAPSYQRALADSGVGPASQKFFAAAGLSAGDVTGVNESSTSSGHTVKLVAAYADGLRMNFFFTVDGKGLTGNPKDYGRNPADLGIDEITVVDQFGRSYQGSGVSGPTNLQFQPLGWPASDVGGRLTLHITSLTNYARQATVIAGDWTLHATLISSAVHSLPPPAPVHTAQADYRYTGISATETEMVVHWTVSGPVSDQLRTPPAPNQPDLFTNPLFDQYLRPHVYSQAGTELQFQEFGYTWPKSGPAQGDMTVFLAGPGRYRIQIGTVAPAAWVVVP